jgi:hypothetical protein
MTLVRSGSDANIFDKFQSSLDQIDGRVELGERFKEMNQPVGSRDAFTHGGIGYGVTHGAAISGGFRSRSPIKKNVTIVPILTADPATRQFRYPGHTSLLTT